MINAAKLSLQGGSGVDEAIHAAAGPKLHDECSQLGNCAVGDAKITKAYDLPCERVIHTVGPIYSVDDAEQAAGHLRSAYQQSLELADRNEMYSISFPAISTGIHGYPIEEAAKVALEAIRDYLEGDRPRETLTRVIICNFSEQAMEIYQRAIPKYFPDAYQS
ncbi:hypothetical protein EYZ11_000487 [Aspergillus tanneri]|uniref:Macro domain-containing protein n=1 Tax=Aspergillus tanneri TaxID=1220188 RepID=A0A4S3JX02_9EURO|nr:uncharacterized protein ATNIH1004_001051 [Aspergillus tanneri]KAA8652147.1 hypothetical protein ATNIH1004_001051 [Aspergillus tanneri]THD00035.1 hypothetical protein EYZ11_000487 [Aspergillus tanneri]